MALPISNACAGAWPEQDLRDVKKAMEDHGFLTADILHDCQLRILADRPAENQRRTTSEPGRLCR